LLRQLAETWWRTFLVFVARRVHYVSTYCIDGQHGQPCRKFCKNCKRPCRCWCHMGETITPDEASI
jgi:hypothetical protein